MVLGERLELSILSELVPKTSASTISPPELSGGEVHRECIGSINFLARQELSEVVPLG